MDVRTESRDGDSSQLRALLVLNGLINGDVATAQANLHAMLFERNSDVRFDCALYTSKSITCSAKDWLQVKMRGSTPGAKQCSCQVNGSRVSSVPYMRGGVSGDGASGFFDDLLVSLSRNRCRLVHSVFVDRPPPKKCDYHTRPGNCFGVPRLTTSPPNNVKPYFQFRLAYALREAREMGKLEAYDLILALRPDVLLTRPLALRPACAAQPQAAVPEPARHPLPPPPSSAVPVVPAAAAPVERPGLVVISGAVARADPFHRRDCDLALLACAPSALELWLRPYLENNASLRCAKGHVPRRRPGFVPWAGARWEPPLFAPVWGKARYECAGMAYLERHRLSLSNLDASNVFATLPAWVPIPGDATGSYRVPGGPECR